MYKEIVNFFTCLSTAYVELEYVTYEVEEGSYLEVCLLAKGYNFSFVLVVDYGSNNTGKMKSTKVQTLGGI